MNLDYSITTYEGRLEHVNKMLKEIDEKELTPAQLERMADYLIYVAEVEKREINTNNRMITINKRETSYEGLCGKLEGGEDSLHTLIKQDKNAILTPTIKITEKDFEDIPMLRQLQDEIDKWNAALPKASGIQKYRIKQMVIDMCKQKYAILNSYKPPIYAKNTVRSAPTYNFDADTFYYDDEGNMIMVSENAITFRDPKHISGLLVNYARLKQNTEEDLHSDLKWMLVDLENLINAAIKPNPVLMLILEMKIDGASNEEIQEMLPNKHSIEYISSLWRNKIPELIAEEYKKQWQDWFFTYKAKGSYKLCRRCNTVKLAHTRFFSRNSSSKSNLYSICRSCRSNKTN